MTNDPRRSRPSASPMHRLAECPGSLALINLLRSAGRLFERQDQAMMTGTRIHRWLALHALGEREGLEGMLKTSELLTAEKCLELRDALEAQWAGARNGDGGGLEVIVERRLWYRQDFRARFSGQPDYVLIDHEGHRALTVNYKTGRLEAEEAADNLQLRAEIVLVKHNWPELTEVAGTIVEPNVSWQSELVVYRQEDLVTAESQILEIVSRTEWEKDKRIAGPWCAKCAAKAHCLEAIRYVQGLPALPQDQAFELPRGERGVEFWERLKVAKKLVDELEKAYIKILEDEPEALPGYVLPEQGRARRFVPDPEKFKQALADYLSQQQVDGCAQYSLIRIEELLGLVHHISGKELSKLFEKLTRNVVSTRFDEPFIRKLTRREREQISVKPSGAEHSEAKLSLAEHSKAKSSEAKRSKA